VLLLLTVLLASCAGAQGSQAVPPPTATSDPHVPFVNVRVSSDRYRVHAEPYLAVNPQDPRNLLAVAQVFDNFQDRAPATFVSFDGGASWQDNGVLPLPGTYLTGTNLTVAFTPQGVGFVVGRLDGPNTTGIFAWRSDDSGRHFHAPVAIVTGNPSAINVDHPWLAVEPTTGSPGSVLYVVWSLMGTMAGRIVGAVMFSRSSDLGQTFAPAVPISGAQPLSVAAPVVVAGPHGHIATVYLDYGAFTGQSDSIHDLQRAPVRVVSSADGGQHFARPKTIGEDRVGSTSTLFATPQAAFDAADGTLYVTFAALRSGTNHSDIVLYRSRDSGQAWIGPLDIAAPSNAADTDLLQPEVAVTSRGAVMISYFARSNGLVEVYLAESTDHGDHITLNQRVNTVSWRFAAGVTTNDNSFVWIGDYQGLASTPGRIYILWNDARDGHLQLYLADVPDP
jgi:hypothetical protein